MDELIPVVVQDVKTNNVLMVAYTNRKALQKTKKTGLMHYWSRSRNKLWKKGETSGHLQRVVSLHYDCDRDAILARVEQTGPACHKNQYSCFSPKSFRAGALVDLERMFEERKRRPKRGSYTVKLLRDPELLRKKVLEEAAELVLARKSDHIVYEAGDLVYHALLLLFSKGIRFSDVEAELRRRMK